MNDLFKLIKEKGKKIDPKYGNAKKNMLGELTGAMDGEMSKELKGLKKPSPMAEEPKEEGVDATAEAMAMGDEEDESGPEALVEQCSSPEELQALIDAAQAKKAEMEGSAEKEDASSLFGKKPKKLSDFMKA